MAWKTERDLDDQERALWLKAIAAVELRNFGYAIELLQNLLRQEPEFITARAMLRRAEVTRLKLEKRSFLAISVSPLAVMKAQRDLKRDPLKTIEAVEKILENEPYNRAANNLLKEAAVAAGYFELAVFAMETLLETNPTDVSILHELGRLYVTCNQNEKALEIYSRIHHIDPGNLAAIKLGKDASARVSMEKGGWSEAESYRDLIRNRELAVSPEEQGPSHQPGRSLECRIQQTYAQHQGSPQNADLARQLGDLHEEKKDWEGAIAWYEYALDLMKGQDRGLSRKLRDLRSGQIDDQIRELEVSLTDGLMSQEQRSQTETELEARKRKRAEILIEDSREQIARNPADLRLRYELGEHLTNARRYREALPELQRARQEPNLRFRAMNLLGHCYRKLGMLDLAVRPLEEACREIDVMDGLKKEILFNLGLVYKQLGDASKYLEAMKQIYDADCGYRDVARRVEASYSRAGGEL